MNAKLLFGDIDLDWNFSQSCQYKWHVLFWMLFWLMDWHCYV